LIAATGPSGFGCFNNEERKSPVTSRRIKLKKAAATAAVAVPAAMGALFVSAEVAGAAPAAGTYIVQPGDTLSAIAASHGTTWTALAESNHLANPNLIFPGQVLELSASSSAPVSSYQSSYSSESYSAPVHTYSAPVEHTYSAPAVQTYSAPVQHTYSAPSVNTVTAAPVSHTTTASSTSASPNSSFQACVINKESSGNAQAMNSSGHYGLYQFDLSTWESGGGSASTFGHASAAQQNSVFNNVYAARGTSPWASYDGC
jgi:LysM repeat protein